MLLIFVPKFISFYFEFFPLIFFCHDQRKM